MSIPRFQFTFVSRPNSKHGYITLGDEKVYHVDDVHEFYSALGYTDEIMKSGLLPEEFIWFEYRKDNSNKSEACLQFKIIEYLSNHSETFKEKYAVHCDNWLERCRGKWINNSAECKDCVANEAIIGLAKES